MSRPGPRTAAAVAVLAALAAVTAACGGREAPAASASGEQAAGSQSPVPAPANVHRYLVNAVDRTLRVHPRHVRSSTTLSGPRGKHVQTVDGHLGERTGSSQAVIVTDGSRSEARVVGRTGWLDSGSPRLREQLPSGTSWLRMDRRRLAGAGIPTPADQLDQLYVLWGMRGQQDMGQATAEGVQARHYAAQVDLDRATCAAPARARSVLHALAPDADGVQVEAWVDAFQLVRRLRVSVDLPGDRKAVYELTLPGDNAAVAVQPPPAGQTVGLGDVPKLRRAFPAAPAPAPHC